MTATLSLEPAGYGNAYLSRTQKLRTSVGTAVPVQHISSLIYGGTRNIGVCGEQGVFYGVYPRTPLFPRYPSTAEITDLISN